MKKSKWGKTELIANHVGCKRVIRELKADCYDKMEIALVDLLLKEHKQLLLEKIELQKKLDVCESCNFKGTVGCHCHKASWREVTA